MCCGISLRTSTYFWTFQHVFLAVVFLLVCGLETFKFSRPENEQGILARVSSEIVVQKSDLYMLWTYGTVYFACGLMIFHGVHKEFPSLIRWTLLLYVIIECCTAGLLKSMIQKKMSTNADLMESVMTSFQTSLVAFFIIVHLFHSMFYVINLIAYCYVLTKSSIVVQKIIYV